MESFSGKQKESPCAKNNSPKLRAAGETPCPVMSHWRQSTSDTPFFFLPSSFAFLLFSLWLLISRRKRYTHHGKIEKARPFDCGPGPVSAGPKLPELR